MRTQKKRSLRGLVAAVAAIGVLLSGGIAQTAYADDPPPTDTSWTITAFQYRATVSGGLPTASAPAPDVTQGYPAAPPVGYQATSPTASLVEAVGDESGQTLQLYCIDLKTGTTTGNMYQLGTWGDADVPNSAYIAQLLGNYFPNAGSPSDVPAVQAAIWFFSDGFILDDSNPVLRAKVAAIVQDVLDRGPAPEPTPPSIAIQAPGSTTMFADQAVGPFVPVANGDVTVTVVGGTMWTADGGTQIADGTTVPAGTAIYLRADPGQTSSTLTAVGSATIAGGTAFLFTKGAGAAQKLILGRNATLTASAEATATFVPFGSLVVDKTIAGEGAGLQGEVVLHVSYPGFEQDFVIPAGTAGPTTMLIERVPLGTVVTITEPADGSSVGLSVEVTGLRQVLVDTAEGAHADVVNTYTRQYGSLVVDKTFTGDGAGLQGEVVLHVSYPGYDRDIVIPARTTAAVSTLIENVPLGTAVTITEPADGSSVGLSVEVTGLGQVLVDTAEGAHADVVNTYTRQYGSLVVDKTFTGDGAGLQGEVVLHVSYPGYDRDIVIPARTTAAVSTLIENVPLGTQVTVTESANGARDGLTVKVTGLGQTLVVAPEGARVNVVNTYDTPKPGTLSWTGLDAFAIGVPAALAAALLAAGAIVLAVRRKKA
ncbi:thioester domain-containing protein [Microbacterium sp. BWT-B31]|uniref:thioester domain-containing protein n=1 Tax=Microbacterium sp. BWT-B31 TaxID=3232072 RepID=UPI00352971D0